MRMIFACLFALTLFVPAHAGEPIADRKAWLSKAVKSIEAGQIDGLQVTLDETLGTEMHDEVMLRILPLKGTQAEEKAVYSDHITTTSYGSSFESHTYAVYYGDRAFVFYTFTFARLEDGWHLFGLDYTDDPAEVL